MRLNKLYIQFFLSILVMLVILFIVVGVTFHVVSQKMRHEQDRPIAGVIAYIMADEQGRLPDLATPGTIKLVRKIATGSQGKIWVTDRDDTVILKTFTGPLPNPDSFRRVKDEEGGTPVVLHDGTPGTMYFVFDETWHADGEKMFFFGLVAAVLTIALLSWPVARHITRPLHRLRETMTRFADGDLSARTGRICCGKGEMVMLANTYNDMADSIERMIKSGRELTANVSHELRSPLARLRIIQQILSERLAGMENERTDGNLKDMEREIEAMDQLIGRILQLSKLSLHPDERIPINVAQRFASILESYGHLFEARGIELRVDAPEDYFLEAEEESMSWMFDNIIANAMKFTPENGLISITVNDLDTECIMEVVNSTARPLPERELESIFEPFQRGSNETAPGTGLGLAIVRRIAERHNGHVEAENTIQGFLLRVTLPK